VIGSVQIGTFSWTEIQKPVLDWRGFRVQKNEDICPNFEVNIGLVEFQSTSDSKSKFRPVFLILKNAFATSVIKLTFKIFPNEITLSKQ